IGVRPPAGGVVEHHPLSYLSGISAASCNAFSSSKTSASGPTNAWVTSSYGAIVSPLQCVVVPPSVAAGRRGVAARPDAAVTTLLTTTVTTVPAPATSPTQPFVASHPCSRLLPAPGSVGLGV